MASTRVTPSRSRQGVDALIARLAGVDVTAVLLYLPAILVPLAFLLAYVAGKTVFGSWSGGVALVVIQAALVGFSRRDHFFEGTGLFETLSQPQAASRLLLAPALLALAVAFAVNGGRVLLVSVAAAGFALAVVHPTYAPYVALVFGGFLEVMGGALRLLGVAPDAPANAVVVPADAVTVREET